MNSRIATACLSSELSLISVSRSEEPGYSGVVSGAINTWYQPLKLKNLATLQKAAVFLPLPGRNGYIFFSHFRLLTFLHVLKQSSNPPAAAGLYLSPIAPLALFPASVRGEV